MSGNKGHPGCVHSMGLTGIALYLKWLVLFVTQGKPEWQQLNTQHLKARMHCWRVEHMERQPSQARQYHHLLTSSYIEKFCFSFHYPRLQY